jgi:hypothetical protein
MIPLTLLYHDEFLVAIDKPAGMIVHPGREPEGPEWIAMKRLRDQLGRQVFPVHRLDRPTSGVLLFALDKQTAGLLQQAFELRNVSKTYHAIVCGITPEQWTCDTPLQKDLIDPLLPASTRFERLKVAPAGSFPSEPSLSLSLLSVTPLRRAGTQLPPRSAARHWHTDATPSEEPHSSTPTCGSQAASGSSCRSRFPHLLPRKKLTAVPSLAL